MPLPNGVKERRAEFDWLRVVALALLIVFHGAIGFSNHWNWHVVDPHDSPVLDFLLSFELRWRVTLVFVVSGAALMLALGTRTPGEVMRDRAVRLLLPLLFAMLVIIPPQIWLERLQRGQFNGSYLAFLSQPFHGFYPAGNLSWHHLWFLPYVLVLSILLLAPFCWVRSPAGRRRLDPVMAIAGRYHLYWLLVLPLVVAELLLHFQRDDSHIFFGDGHGWLVFTTLMVLGGGFALWPGLLKSAQRGRWASLALGIVAFGLLDLMGLLDGVKPHALGGLAMVEWAVVSAVNMLAWVLTIAGFLTRWLTRGSPALSYASEAALPIYILHQTLTVACVYLLHKVGWPLPLKLLLTVSVTVLGALAIYELVIRRTAWLRPLFGLKLEGASLTSRWNAPASSDRRPS